jgi:hypothetical protein
MLNASQLAQSYTTALACPVTSATNAGATLLTTANPTQLSALQQHHSQTTSPYIFLSTSATTSDEVCANAIGGNDITGKTATLSSPSTLYFYNNNSTPTMYPTEFLRL